MRIADRRSLRSPEGAGIDFPPPPLGGGGAPGAGGGGGGGGGPPGGGGGGGTGIILQYLNITVINCLDTSHLSLLLQFIKISLIVIS